jgi:hypothetical protein
MSGWSINPDMIKNVAENKIKEDSQNHKDSDFITYVKTKGIYDDLDNVNSSIDIAVNLRNSNSIDDATYKTLTVNVVESFKSTLDLLKLNYEDFEDKIHKF